MADPTPVATPTAPIVRGNRRMLTGVVTRDKMDKTRRVEIPWLVKHARYSKYIKRRTICYAHDETNESRIGDTVEIMETRPLSKNKNWRMVRIITKAPRASETKENKA
jgi:small subunit ribosomal protein S17